MNQRTAAKELKEGQPRPVYVLYGKDRFRMQEFVAFMTECLLQPDERQLGVVKFNTADAPIEEAVLEAETVPFFVPRKIVIVRDQTLLAAGGKETAKLEHQPDRLLEYLKQPSETSTIVLMVLADKLDERRKLVKRLKDQDALLPFAELQGAELMRWMQRRVQEQRRELAEAAAELLAVRCGGDLQRVAQELDKLCLHAGPDGRIAPDHVEALTEATVDEDVFALVDAITALEAGKAIAIYRALLLRREEPIKIAALLARQFRIMLQIKELDGQQYGQQQIAAQLGLHPYAVKLAAEKSRRFARGVLAAHLAKLAELDYQMKTGRLDKALGLELFLLEICAQGHDVGIRT
ncbi:DNA polymerase III subunit delta [Paenibacillus sp. IB182496]|uniref:DNA polymerase III subunit delta n=1 Tax=Paenibacillus sabuli TaxID=2772509 RepID=A0A927BRS1_9BACL|nr:DNA polymerase III subunit delta [Paenibacillus sabuli]MBD2844480.1 DNA polymerase III subunit delta [Paenibacillus sabuli]